MKRLLIVHHTPSPPLHSLLESVRSGATDPSIEGVEVLCRPALGTSVSDVLEADAYVLGTPANFGYMSGALKHFFDTIYYPCLDATRGRSVSLYVHGNDDTAGAVASIQKLLVGLDWRLASAALEVTGGVDADTKAQAWELGAVASARL